MPSFVHRPAAGHTSSALLFLRGLSTLLLLQHGLCLLLALTAAAAAATPTGIRFGGKKKATAYAAAVSTAALKPAATQQAQPQEEYSDPHETVASVSHSAHHNQPGSTPAPVAPVPAGFVASGYSFTHLAMDGEPDATGDLDPSTLNLEGEYYVFVDLHKQHVLAAHQLFVLHQQADAMCVAVLAW